MAGKTDKKGKPVIQEIDMEHYPLPGAKAPKGLKPQECRWRVDPKTLGFKTTAEIKPLKTIVGQPRASNALKLGAEIRGHGYNIFVTGLSATGRAEAIKNIFAGFNLNEIPGRDHCYVNNFRSPDEPRLLVLPKGKGRKFKVEMSRLVNNLKNTVPHALEDETVLTRKRELAEQYARKEADLFKKLENKVGKSGFALVQVQMGPYTRPDVFPVIEGEPVPPNQVGKFVEEGKFPKDRLDELYKKYTGYKADLRNVLKAVRQLNRELAEKTESIEREVLQELLHDICEDLGEKFNFPSVRQYLCECEEYIIGHPEIFSADESEMPGANPAMPSIPNPFEDPRASDPFRQFEVNVVHDATLDGREPVIIENHPNYHNLFGSIEREMRLGGFFSTDFTQIRGGSILRADGGYLILNAMDVLQEPLSWRTLMRTLKTGKLQIQGLDTLMSIAPATLKPEPIDIDVSVIIIGEEWLYYALTYYEDDFPRVFKVRADFDSLMPRGKKEITYYASLASKMNKNESTLHLTSGGIAKLAEQGARIAGSGGKMSARLGEIADIIREASHNACDKGKKVIDGSDIEFAVSEMEFRQDLIRERMDEAYKEALYIIDIKGCKVGQINGLAIISLGSFAFGRPQRITCEVSMGDAGVVNIEREAKLSGSIHDKGVLILEGYLRHMYGMDGPINLSASITFEQSYSHIDGDSASLAEALLLLSELSGMPLRQDLAVTGSINQKGEVQPIGGVNYKIEGFFRVCKMLGLTGTQGVVIPKSNAAELMLSDDVLAAMALGKFHIYPVSKVDQAIEIFTGVTAGRKLKRTGFTKGSVHDRVDITLSDFYYHTKGGSDKDDEELEAEKIEKLGRKPRKKKAENDPE